MKTTTCIAIVAAAVACAGTGAVHAQTSRGVVPVPPTTTPALPTPALPPGVTGIPPTGSPPRGLPPNPDDRFRVPPDPGVTTGDASPSGFNSSPPVSVPSIGQTNPGQPMTVPSIGQTNPAEPQSVPSIGQNNPAQPRTVPSQ